MKNNKFSLKIIPSAYLHRFIRIWPGYAVAIFIFWLCSTHFAEFIFNYLIFKEVHYGFYILNIHKIVTVDIFIIYCLLIIYKMEKWVNL